MNLMVAASFEFIWSNDILESLFTFHLSFHLLRVWVLVAVYLHRICYFTLHKSFGYLSSLLSLRGYKRNGGEFIWDLGTFCLKLELFGGIGSLELPKAWPIYVSLFPTIYLICYFFLLINFPFMCYSLSTQCSLSTSQLGPLHTVTSWLRNRWWFAKEMGAEASVIQLG